MLARVAGILTLLTAISLAATPSATAQEKKPDFAAAKKHFKAGQAFVQMDKFAEAIVEFKKAHQITRDDLVMGQIAMTYEKAGDYEAALAAIRVYRSALPEGERASADALIKKYEQAIKDGKSTKLVLPSEKPAAGEGTETGETSGETGTKEGEETEEEGTGRKGRFYTWIAAGAAGALALSALIVGLNAQSKYDELSGTCSPACDPAEVDSVKTRAVVTDVLWGTAAAAAVAAGVLWWLEGRSLKQDKERGPVEGEDDLDDDLVQRFRVAPLVGGGTYGIGGEIKF